MKGINFLLGITVFILFALIVVGAYVAAGGFGEACGSQVPSDWPLCNGNLLPAPQLGPVVEYTHRLLAALSALFLFATTFVGLRGQAVKSSVKRSLIVASILLVFQIVLGGVVVANELNALLVAVHQAIALLIFGLVVAAISFSLQQS
ncbi:MAG: COX15/CtaA family protein [Nitrososphaerales archaeon]|nr:COX15/CtaA family protein [Nitrososphaerales archaeon]